MFLHFKNNISQHFLLCAVTLVCVYGAVNTLEYDDSSEDDACIVLPPTPPRTSVAGESELNIVDFLNGGVADMLKGSDFPADAILILGNTGSGKTTLTQILTSNLTRLHAVKTEGGKMVIIDDDERIGVPSTISRTLTPELVTFESNGITTYFYDCPGFEDTRGPVQDLAANFFMNQIISRVNRVKMLFLVPHYAVQPAMDRLAFDLLVKHATQFIRNVDKFKYSVGLVATKVEGEFLKLKEKHLLRGIVSFISEYNATLGSQLRKSSGNTSEEILKKIDFVRILLHQNPEGVYDRISFSRSPDKCGSIGESETVTNSKIKITNLYQQLEYTSVDSPSNFGYTVKPETIQSVQKYTTDVNNAIAQKVREVVDKLSVWFDREKLSGGSDQVAIISGSVQSCSTDIKNLLDKLLLLTDPSEFSTAVKLSLVGIGYVEAPHEFQVFMNHQSSYLNFFDNVTGTSVDRSIKEWSAPITDFLKELELYRDWYNFVLEAKNILASYDIQRIPPNLLASSQDMDWLEWIKQNNILIVGDHLETIYRNLDNRHKNILSAVVIKIVKTSFTENVNNAIVQKVREVVDKLRVWFDREKLNGGSDQVAIISGSVQSCYTEIKNLLDKLLLLRDPSEFSTDVKTSFEKIGYGDVSHEFQMFMNHQSSYLNFFDSVTRALVNRSIKEWSAPLNDFLKQLELYRDWYSVVLDVKNRLASYDIQLIPPNLLAQQVASPQDMDWLAWIKQNNILAVDDHLESIYRNLDNRHKNILSAVVIKIVKTNFANNVNNAIVQKVREVVDKLRVWFDHEKLRGGSDQVSFISRSLQSSCIEMENLLKQLLSLPAAPSNFATSVKTSFEKIGYGDVSHEFQVFMNHQSSYLNSFESVTRALVNRSVKEWSAPITDFLKLLEKYWDWYNFLAQVKNMVMSYDFQAKKPEMPDDNLPATGWLYWVGQHRSSLVSERLKVIGRDLDMQQPMNLLKDIIRWSTEPAKVECNSERAVVKGNFVRFGDFLDTTGYLKGQCRNVDKLEVYAGDTVFLNANLNGGGKLKNTVVIAPNWNVIGRVILNLDGTNGPDVIPGKAAHGYGTGAGGQSGVSGKPGSPGGAFLGFARRIQGANHLKISSKGGNGGRGQDGGDGTPGRDGGKIDYRSSTRSWSVHLVDRTGTHGEKGQDGGDGGSGGVCGLGGKSGSIKINSEDGHKVSVITGDGAIGAGGLGGLGAPGGKGSQDYICRQKSFVGFSGRTKCVHEWIKPDGTHGKRGLDDWSSEGREQPRQAYQMPEAKIFTNAYRSVFEKSENKDTQQFIRQL